MAFFLRYILETTRVLVVTRFAVDTRSKPLLERIWTIKVHEISECHELLSINIDTSLATTELLGSNIDLDTDVLDHLENVIKALVKPPRVMLQHVVFLNFISFLTNDIPIVFPINDSKNFNVVFVKMHRLIHDIAHLPTFILNVLWFGVLKLLIKFVVLFLFLVNFFLIMLINFNFGLRMVIKTEIMVESFICYNLSKASW